MNQTQDFVIAPDDRVEFSFARELGEVARVFFQCPVAGFSLRVGDALSASQILDRGVDAVTRQPGGLQNTRGGRVAFRQNGEEDVLGGDVFVFEAVCLLVGEVNDPLDARGDEDLSRAAAEDVGFRAGAQGRVETVGQRVGADAQFFENLGDHPAGLFDQRQQDVFGVYLVVAVALDDLRSALGGFLGSLGKSVKSHHGESSFSPNLTGFTRAIPVQNTCKDKGDSPSNSNGNLSGFSVEAIITKPRRRIVSAA